MKLYHSPASPYARKVRVCAIECGLEAQLELVLATPHDADDHLHQINPLGRVPALVTDEGWVLVDSPVICEYLDHQSAAPHPLFPTPGPRRWSALRRQALGDGIMDSAVPWRQELLRSEGPSQDWLSRRQHQITATLAFLLTLESELDTVDIGNISLACALDYLLFRFGEHNWPDRFPSLYEWHSRFCSRDSFQRTRPE
ncbi:MAG: glutathione S-transferase N-terminal domain-containing protein [Candidatus Eremiobacteraeota bacterium]|nr:glutathione S-transferase N-terminal domain-containing protein [Candidatus Eremiobacteraeota bacterium]